MKSQVLLFVAALLASGSALSATSQCEADCERSHKYCVSSDPGSERACMLALEKCRKTCLKKQKSELAK